MVSSSPASPARQWAEMICAASACPTAAARRRTLVRAACAASNASRAIFAASKAAMRWSTSAAKAAVTEGARSSFFAAGEGGEGLIMPPALLHARHPQHQVAAVDGRRSPAWASMASTRRNISSEPGLMLPEARTGGRDSAAANGVSPMNRAIWASASSEYGPARVGLSRQLEADRRPCPVGRARNRLLEAFTAASVWPMRARRSCPPQRLEGRGDAARLRYRRAASATRPMLSRQRPWLRR